jgi:TonB family protein
MKKHKKRTRVRLLRFTIIVSFALFMVLSGNARTVATSIRNLLSTAKDTVINDKKIGQTPIDSTTRTVKPVFNLPDKDSIYIAVDKMPVFPGGEHELLSFIGHNLKYPVEAQQKGIQGRILVKFIVSKSGKVEKAQIVRGLDPSIDKEGLRVVNSLPDFIPGELKGEKVSVYYVLPITFKLTSTSKTSTLDLKKIPVFVMDGKVLPIGYNMTTINRDSIQSVDVLKPDTEAKKAELISKYGEGAVNGVIVITKKKQAH